MEVIKNELGSGVLERMKNRMETVYSMMQAGLAEIAISDDPAEVKQEKAQRYLDAWKEFGSGLFDSTETDRANPERVDAALRGAAAAMKGERPVQAVKMQKR